MSETKIAIGQLVRQFRKERGLSQDQLAEGICSRQTISFLENGQHFPSIDIVQKIADRLGVPFHEIMIDHESEHEAKTQLDIIKVYTEIGDYDRAWPLIERLNSYDELLDYQRRELILYRSENLLKTGRANDAVICLEEFLHKLEQQRESDDHFLATVYDKLGTAHYFLSNIANAHAYYMRAYQLTLLFPSFDLVAAKITYNLGMTCRLLDRFSEAIDYLTRAMSFFNQMSDTKRLAQTMFELGINYRNQRNYEQAQSLAMYKMMNIHSMAWQVRETYAFTVLSHQNPDAAIQEMLDCISEFEKLGNYQMIGFTYAGIAYIYLNKDRATEAFPYIQKSLQALKTDSKIENTNFAFAYRVYSMYLLNVREYDASVEYSFKSSEIFDRMGLVRDAAESLKVCADAFRKQGLFEQVDQVSQKIISLLSQAQERYSTILEAVCK